MPKRSQRNLALDSLGKVTLELLVMPNPNLEVVHQAVIGITSATVQKGLDAGQRNCYQFLSLISLIELQRLQHAQSGRRKPFDIEAARKQLKRSTNEYDQQRLPEYDEQCLTQRLGSTARRAYLKRVFDCAWGKTSEEKLRRLADKRELY